LVDDPLAQHGYRHLDVIAILANEEAKITLVLISRKRPSGAPAVAPFELDLAALFATSNA
jgi:hypothetical protein